MAEDADRWARLEARLEAAEKELEELRRSGGPARHVVTMKRNCECPACGERTVLHAPRILDRAHGGQKAPFSITVHGFWRQNAVGELEAYVCCACGFVEWYVNDPATLEKLPELDPAYVITRAEGGHDPSTPYR